jgi:hypothetical protein
MLGHMMQAPEPEDLMDPFVMNGSLPMGQTMASKLPLISVVGNNFQVFTTMRALYFHMRIPNRTVNKFVKAYGPI